MKFGIFLEFWLFAFLSFREREDQIQKLSEVQKQQAQQAEHALEDFKSQVERNSGRMFDEMKAQVKLILLIPLDFLPNILCDINLTGSRSVSLFFR